MEVFVVDTEINHTVGKRLCSSKSGKQLSLDLYLPYKYCKVMVGGFCIVVKLLYQRHWIFPSFRHCSLLCATLVKFS